MGQISLRPELVTDGGEACGIMLDDQYVGSLTLVYREQDRIWGTVQLDEEMLDTHEKEDVGSFIQRHIQHMIDALGVPECLVTVTYSEYDHVISTDDIGHVEELVQVETVEEGLGEDVFGDEWFLDEDDFHLTIVGESRNRVEYQVHNENEELVAEAVVFISRGDATGEVIWLYEPAQAEIDATARLLVSDFDPDAIDTFAFVMYYDEEEVATIELTHEDLLDAPESEEEIMDEGIDKVGEGLDMVEGDVAEDVYIDIYDDEDTLLHFELIRDELDVLIYDLYEEGGRRASRLGTVTVDVATSEMTALVDFSNPREQQLREQIAYHLIDMLEEDVQFETLTVTMQYHDEVIDEYHFDIDEQPDREFEPGPAVFGEADHEDPLYS